jgi:hypothetical protein
MNILLRCRFSNIRGSLTIWCIVFLRCVLVGSLLSVSVQDTVMGYIFGYLMVLHQSHRPSNTERVEMSIYSELQKSEEKTIITHFRVRSWHLLGMSEETYRKSRSWWGSTPVKTGAEYLSSTVQRHCYQHESHQTRNMIFRHSTM